MQRFQAQTGVMQMSDAIGFLEKMGQDAQLRNASKHDVELALASAFVDPRTRSAILDGDKSTLETLLGGGAFFSVQFPGQEDEQEDEGEGDERENEESHSLERAK